MARQAEWWAQNEATDADGFFLDGEEAWEAEKRALAAMGCPALGSAVLVSHEAIDRDEAVFVAVVPDEAADWLATAGVLLS